MKKFLIMTTFLGLGMLVSCADNNKTDGNGDAVIVTPDMVSHYEGESFKFTVKSSDGTDISSNSVITVDNNPVTNGSFYSTTAGTFTVKATYSGIVSQPVQITVTENPVPLTSITVTPNAVNVVAGDVVTFSAMGDNGSNLSQSCKYYVNGNPISGNTYTSTQAGSLEVYATYGETTKVTSQTTAITVNDPINFTKRVLIEDYTGQWCGWCPRVAKAIEMVNAQTDKAVPVAIHVASGSQGVDIFNFSGVQTLAQTFGISSFPNGKLNRKTTWSSDETTHIKQVIDLTAGANPRVGLAMTTNITGAQATVDVKVKFGQNFSGLKLVVYVLEDKLIGDQHNYTSYYSDMPKDKNNTILGFEYNDVLRSCLTNVLGDDITGSTNFNEEYSKSFTYNIPEGVNAANVHFVAFVVDSTKKALNVRNAGNNVTQEFETGN